MTKLPTPKYGANTDETIKNLFGVVMKFRKELEYALNHLDDGNILNLDALKLFNVEDLFAQNVVTNTMVTQTLSADKGYIAELTVDQLDTSDKVRNYLNSDTSDVNYIRIYDQYIEFITATTDGLETEQLTDRNGDLVYWKDANKDVISYEDTGIPVIVYVYEELTKMSIKFETDPESGYYNPVLQLGAGDGVLPNSSKGKIYKDTTGIRLEYYKSETAEKVGFYLTDNGVYCSDVLHNLIPVQDTPPENPEEGDLWIDTTESETISDEQGTELVGGGDTNLHTHDGRYYTETEIQDMFMSFGGFLDEIYANIIHLHTEDDISDLDKYTQDEVNNLLDDKAEEVHSHTENDINDLDKYTQAQVDTKIDDTLNMMQMFLEPYIFGYIYEQSTPSDTWTIEHNLNKMPQVTIVDSSGNQVETEIEYIDSNTVQSKSNGSFSGKAFVN